MDDIRMLFGSGLQRLRGAHEQGAAQAHANIDTSTAPELRRMLRAGVKANQQQGRRLEQVFASAGLTPTARSDQAMQGIIDANRLRIGETADPLSRDLLNIMLGQVAAHFYLASYGTLRSYALAMGNTEAAALLGRTLDETGKVDRAFSALARRLIRRANPDAFLRRGPGVVASLVRPAAVVVIGGGLLALVTGVIDGAGRR
jgi:ferritin-like metal-binding protein YciE